MLKWERKLAAAAGDPSLATSCESEFLDFLQHHYWSLMCELYWEAMRFEAVQVSESLPRPPLLPQPPMTDLNSPRPSSVRLSC